MPVELPPEVVPLVDALADASGAVAVALGGSRATDTADAQSDWDFTLYYRGVPDLSPLERFGTVYPPGSWGRIMNGGGWFHFGAIKADVMLRDLDVVERWSERAERGEYEIDALLAYLAGVPTYLLLAERAQGVTLRGTLPPAPPFPARLAEVAATRWRYNCDFTLALGARPRAARGDVVGAVGEAAKAAIQAAHSILCARREWVLNEKRILARAGLSSVHELFAAVPRASGELAAWHARVEAALAPR